MYSVTQLYGIRLTRREKEIHGLIAQGLSSKQVAAKLLISIYTVANHRKSILKKKGIKSIRVLLA